MSLIYRTYEDGDEYPFGQTVVHQLTATYITDLDVLREAVGKEAWEKVVKANLVRSTMSRLNVDPAFLAHTRDPEAVGEYISDRLHARLGDEIITEMGRSQ